MNLLLDTHVLLWWLAEPATLSTRAREAIADPDRDPFDRMIVAQALGEGLTVVTRDSSVAAYGIPTLGA